MSSATRVNESTWNYEEGGSVTSTGGNPTVREGALATAQGGKNSEKSGDGGGHQAAGGPGTSGQAADDMKTDPSGNSGDRIACGVIIK